MKYHSDDLKPKIVLGVVAHPDDLDFGFAGSVAKWAADGASIYYFILTNGNKGSADPQANPDELKETRREEQRAAAKILGVKEVSFSDHEDGMLEVTADLKKEIVTMIRRIKPDVVLTFDPAMLYDADRGFINHPDHRAAGQATLDAVFPLARDHMSFPELAADGLPPHITPTVLLLNFSEQNYAVDITRTIETKLRALEAHVSQIPDNDLVAQKIRDQAAQTGKTVGVDYAESFLRITLS